MSVSIYSNLEEEDHIQKEISMPQKQRQTLSQASANFMEIPHVWAYRDTWIRVDFGKATIVVVGQHSFFLDTKQTLSILKYQLQ